MSSSDVSGDNRGHDPPNIILCMTDDQGWGDVAYNGHPHLETPHMDAMATDGIRFDRFYSAAPVCSPTRGSCLTGRHPFRYGVFEANSGHLPSEEITIADALQTQGYTTGHFGKWHLGTLTTVVRDSNRGGPRGADHYAPPWRRGFDECFSTEASLPTWDPMIAPEIAAVDGQIEEERVGDAYGTYYWTGPGHVATDNLDGSDSGIIMDRALSFISNAVRSETPFFAVVWFHAPHTPVVAGEDYRERYRHVSEGKQHYYGTITAIDAQIGRLRTELADLGVAEETMLWFNSDNGPSGFDSTRTQGETGNLRGRKDELYEGGIRVPGTLVWLDGIEEPRTVDVPCVTSDFYPTVMEILGLEMSDQPTPIDGTSLLPLLKGEMEERPVPIGFEHSDTSQAWIDNDYKLIRPDEGSDFQLYNLAKDPYETNDLSSEFPDRASAMREALEKWHESCHRSRDGADYPDSR